MRYLLLLIPAFALAFALSCDDQDDQVIARTARPGPEAMATAEPTEAAELRLLFPGLPSTDELSLYSVGADGTGLTLVARLEGGAVLSPDGERVAFACPQDEAQTAPSTEICLGTVGGPAARVDVGEEFEGIVWAPDSRRLAFATVLQDDEVGVLFGTGVSLIDADGRNLQRLIPAAPGVILRRLQWSPEGRRLAFLADRLRPVNPVQRTDLEVVHLEDGTLTNLTEQIVEAGEFQTGVEEFAWAPDGSALAFVRNSLASGGNVELYTVAPDASGLRQLTDTRDWHEIQAVWSPDGQSLAVSAAPAGSGPARVFIVPAAGGEGRPLGPDLSRSDYPVWSPDGRRVAFAGAEGALGTCPALSLYVADLQNGTPRALAGGQQLVLAPFITWSPDGRYLFYTPGTLGGDEPDPSLEECGSSFLFSVPVDGSASPAQLTDFTVSRFLGWQPQP